MAEKENEIVRRPTSFFDWAKEQLLGDKAAASRVTITLTPDMLESLMQWALLESDEARLNAIKGGLQFKVMNKE